jgi:hypothetical protein
VAVRSKAWVCGRSLAGIVWSNPAGGIIVCLLLVLFVVKQRSLRRADHSSWGVLPRVVCVSVWSLSLDNTEAMAHLGCWALREGGDVVACRGSAGYEKIYQLFIHGTNRPALVSTQGRSWKSRAIPLLPLWAVRPVQSLSACTKVHFTFIFGHERVELYLYSPYGPYGLYRASVPVQRCTLPLPLVMKE